MSNIRKSDIDFSRLTLLSNEGSNGTIYTDGVTCYKLLDKMYPDEVTDLYYKLCEMEGINIDGVILPEDFIISDNRFVGYSMPFFKNSMSISDKYFTRYLDTGSLFSDLNKASSILRKIHESGIVCQDISFENILVDVNGNVMFCDMDACKYDHHNSQYISYMLKRFMCDYRRQAFIPNSNTDRISMMISMYYLIFALEIQKVSRKSFLSMSDKLDTIYDSVGIANRLIDRNNKMGYIPYLDEIISLNDDVIIDRCEEKQKEFRRRLILK